MCKGLALTYLPIELPRVKRDNVNYSRECWRLDLTMNDKTFDALTLKLKYINCLWITLRKKEKERIIECDGHTQEVAPESS